MTLELPHATTSHTAKESGGASNKTTKHAKDSEASPLGFLALLMELDLHPETDALVEQPAQGLDPTAQAPLLSDAMPAAVPIAAEIDAMAVPTVLPSIPAVGARELRIDKGLAQVRGGGGVDSALPKDEMGRKTGRSPVLRAAAEPLGTLGTKQLQQEGKWAQLEVPVVREYQGAAHETTIGSATPVAPVVVVPVEESCKVPHAINAKVDSADNMVVLSGLSGAMTGTPELMPVDKQNQLQSAIAQEVTYFISKDIQNAEMKLEGLGGAAVEVSINMQGKEAQVVFRSDEVQTREVLENAAAHLKDMLQQEGVVLTGVYVGTSGTGESGQQERKFRSGLRSEGMLAIQPSGPGATASLSGVGRTLDLYV